jgi:hypothetical protein
LEVVFQAFEEGIQKRSLAGEGLRCALVSRESLFHEAVEGGGAKGCFGGAQAIGFGEGAG